MELVLNDLGKLYGETWIIKNLNAKIESGTSWGVKGSNGAGKSTLLHLLLGLALPSKGSVQYNIAGKPLDRDAWSQHYTFTAPYAQIHQEFKPLELLGWARRFRPLLKGMTDDKFMELASLTEHQDKYLHQFSTGMLQRFKVSLTLATEGDLIVLDEPTSNLDQAGKTWFSEIVESLKGKRTIIIASNEDTDFVGCQNFIELIPPR